MIEIINIILNNNDLIYFLIKYNIEKKENLEDIEKKEILKSISEENLEDILYKLKKKEFLKKKDYYNIKILLRLEENKDFLYEYFQNLNLKQITSTDYYAKFDDSDKFFVRLENLQNNYEILKDYIDNIENKNYKININKLKSAGNRIFNDFKIKLNYLNTNSGSKDEIYRELDKIELFYNTYKDLFMGYNRVDELETIENNIEKIRKLVYSILYKE
jgi:hypothetical protein